MHPIDADQLPVGFVRVGAAGLIVETNHAFRAWADCNAPEGRALTEFLVPIDDFLEAESRPGMMARPDRADRTAFLIASDDGASFAVVDASERYAAGRALREARRLADRTQKRLQLVIDSSIAFAEATTEEGLAEILATTAAEAYRAEDATVYLADESETLIRISGTNPFEEWSSADSTQLANFGLRQVLKVSGWVEAAALSPRLGEVMQATGVHSVIAAPLHLDGEVLGVFVCFFHHPRQFDEEAARWRRRSPDRPPRAWRTFGFSVGSSTRRAMTKPPAFRIGGDWSWRAKAAPARRWPFCSSTSTVSRRSTTFWVTSEATTSCGRSRCVCGR
jgi:hypothetical protein